MQIETFKVSGFRSLADIDDVPVRSPTILTGANDGGKTALLQALRFLLGGKQPTPEDRTWGREDEDPSCGLDGERHYNELCVTGRFSLDPDEQQSLGLPAEIELHRRVGATIPATYEILVSVPGDPRLRDLDDNMSLEELRRRAAELTVGPEGRANAKASYIGPLRRRAAEAPMVVEWIRPAPRVIERLPRFVEFASTEAPDPEREIRSSLAAVFQSLIEDEDIVGPVRKVENQLRDRLTIEAQALRDHIKMRCPELSEIDVVPSVSFSSGFQGVTLLAARGEDAGVGLRASGAGRRRRITLAVWEWTTKLLERAEAADRSVVIAYDEPDTHLDYSHQRELVDLIRAQAAHPATRILVATHSLNLIDKVDIEDVIHVTLDSGRTLINRLAGGEHATIDRYLADVSAAMGLRNSVLLHERCFVAVEGSTEAQAFPILFRLATGYSLQAAGLALIAGNSNEGALKVAKFLNDHGRRIHFVIDRDSTTQRGKRKIFRPEALRAQSISDEQMHLVGDPDELEDLFSDDQWAATANEVWPRADGHPWTATDFRALRGDQTISFSDGLERMIRPASEQAPSGKPGYVLAVAHRLQAREDVPQQLCTAFDRLLAIADVR